MLSSEISEKPLCGLEVRFHNTTLRAQNRFVATLATSRFNSGERDHVQLRDFLLGEEE